MSDAGRYPLPAIVLGCDKTGLGALRSLHLAGITTYVACPPGDLVTSSRWFMPTPGEKAWDGSLGSRALDTLRNMPLERAVIIPGADDAALWLADLPQSDVGARFATSSSSRETLETLQDKSRFNDFLSRMQVPHPRTFSITSAADVDAIPFGELD